MFSEASVSHSFHRGWLPSMHHRLHDWGIHSGEVCIREGVCIQEGGLHPGGSTSRGVYIQGRGSASRGGGLHPGEGVYIQGRGSASR